MCSKKQPTDCLKAASHLGCCWASAFQLERCRQLTCCPRSTMMSLLLLELAECLLSELLFKCAGHPAVFVAKGPSC